MALKLISKMNNERRVIFIIGAVLLVLGAIYRFMPDWGISDADKEGHRLIQTRIEKYTRMVQSRRQIKENLLTLTRNLEKAENGLFDAKTPALAAVEIQDLIMAALKSAGLETDKIYVIKPQPIQNEPFMRIAVRTVFNSDIEKLQQVLYKIESSDKLLSISQLQLNAPKASLQSKTDIRTDIIVQGVMYMNPENQQDG